MRLRLMAFGAITAAALSLALGGAAPAGRALLRAGLPAAALPLLDDPQWRGLALYELGRYGQAAELFRIAGPQASYNRGTALARDRQFEAALQAFEAVMARDPAHAGALANYRLILPLTGNGTESGSGGQSRARQLGDRMKTNQRTGSMTVEEAYEKLRVRSGEIRRPMENKEISANEQWLSTLSDEPGRYLKLRIAAEYRRRKAAGTAPPPGDDPW